jgi:predicted amidohydrolase
MPDETTAEAVGQQLRVALTQMRVSRDIESNVDMILDLIRLAAADRPHLILLPENCLFQGGNAEMRAAALPRDSAVLARLCASAREAATCVVLGGFKERMPDGAIFNSALVIDASGAIRGSYHKIHLFDACVAGITYRASSVETPGTTPVILGIGDVKIGLTICYDLRFPELYRTLALAGAQVFCVPAAFTQATGAAHWEVLLRARAIENAAFVVASATISGSDSGPSAPTPTYGHALAVDPWGRVLVDLGVAGHAHHTVTLDLERVVEARNAIPVLRNVQAAASLIPRLISFGI